MAAADRYVAPALEALEARTATMDQRLTERLDTLTRNVEKLTEGLINLEATSQRILQAIEADREIAKIQAENIQQLSKIATALISKIAA